MSIRNGQLVNLSRKDWSIKNDTNFHVTSNLDVAFSFVVESTYR